MEEYTTESVLKKGGEWLGALRAGIKIAFANGEDVTWGSGDVLSPPVTVVQLERMTALAVAADRHANKLALLKELAEMAEWYLKTDDHAKWYCGKHGTEDAPSRITDDFSHAVVAILEKARLLTGRLADEKEDEWYMEHGKEYRAKHRRRFTR